MFRHFYVRHIQRPRGVQWHFIDPRGRGHLGVEPPPKHAIAVKPSVLCCHLTNTNEELDQLAIAIPLFCQITLVFVHT